MARLGARVEHDLVDRDRPDPDRADQQPDHHRLDDPMRVPEQREQRQVGGGERQHRLCHVGRIHGHSPLPSAIRLNVGRTGRRTRGPKGSGGSLVLRRKPDFANSRRPPTATAKIPRNLAKLGHRTGPQPLTSAIGLTPGYQRGRAQLPCPALCPGDPDPPRMAVRSGLGIGRARPPDTKATCTAPRPAVVAALDLLLAA